MGRFSLGNMVDIMTVTPGSRWMSTDRKIFHVITVVEVDGHTWVHYAQDNTNESKEFSCYVESFLERFKPTAIPYDAKIK